VVHQETLRATFVEVFGGFLKERIDGELKIGLLRMKLSRVFG
jgi:hypothetical protein